MKYRVHPVAQMFPLIDDNSQEWFDLVASVEHHGQLEPIIVDGDTLIDGRNRLRACEKLKREPVVKEWSTLGVSASQAAWIESKNLNRRHLTADQRAMITTKIALWIDEKESAEAKKAAQFKPGNKAASETAHLNSGEPSRDIKAEHARSTAGKIAKKAGVSRHKAEQAIKVQKADPELTEDVISGAKSLAAAAKNLRQAERPTKPATPIRERVIQKLKALISSFEPSEQDEVKQILRDLL